jgi:hypothetical protein
MNNKMHTQSALSSGSAANTQGSLAGSAGVAAAAGGGAANWPPTCYGECLAVTQAASICGYGTAKV